MSWSRLNQYHRVAADVLVGKRAYHVVNALLQAAEEGDLEEVSSLLEHHRGIVDLKCDVTGDTALIAAARAGHNEVVSLLLSYEADCTLLNDAGESVLDVCSVAMKKFVLDSISHHGSTASNPQILLHSAWLGDAVSIRKSASGPGLDVNCRNNDGLTPVLLVTRDSAVFEKMQHAMKSEYNPLAVLQELIKNDADVNATDSRGYTALHMMAANRGIHAKKMASLLLEAGADSAAENDEQYTPLHLASEAGHTAIIVALVEEGNADVNQKGGMKGDTPLMLSAEHGHKEVTRYLLEKGADVTATDSLGNTAISVAKTPSLVKMLEDAWTEQTKEGKDVQIQRNEVPFYFAESEDDDEKELEMREGEEETNMGTAAPVGIHSISSSAFHVEHRQLSANGLETDCSDSNVDDGPTPLPGNGQTPDPILPASEAEADDELESDTVPRRSKPATRRSHIRQTMEDAVARRGSLQRERTDPRRDPPSPVPGNLRPFPPLDRRHPSPRVNDRRKAGPADGGGPGAGRGRPQGVGRQRPFPGQPQAQVHGDVLQRSLSSLSPTTESLPPTSPLRGCSAIGVAEAPGQRKMTLPGLRGASRGGERSRSSFLTSQLITKSSSADQLPTLPANFKPVALLTVDGENERMQIHKYKQQQQKQESPSSGGRTCLARQNTTSGSRPTGAGKQLRHERQRSKTDRSLSRTPSPCPSSRRMSTGSITPDGPGESEEGPAYRAGAVQRVPFLPSVVCPTLSAGLTAVSPRKPATSSTPPGYHRTNTHGRASRLGQAASQSSGRFLPQPPSSLNLVVTRQLASVAESGESSSSDKTITPSAAVGRELATPQTPPTLDSPGAERVETLLAARNLFFSGGFRADSLENAAVVSQARAVTKPAAQASNNVVVNYAVNASGNHSLSPIWNQMQLMRSESESTSSSYGEYITSFIGRRTPFPHNLLSPEVANAGARKVPGTDSGNGESDEESRRNSSSSSDNDEMPFMSEIKWKKGHLLGKGAYGKVWEGLMDSAKLIAVKEVELDMSSQERAQTQFKKIQMEVDILRSLHHKNMVQYWGASMDMATIYIFMEYISGGSLQSILKRFGALDERTIAHYTRQIARGLHYLHHNGIIHRDIKGANIMLTSKGVIKLIDFGCAKRYCQEVSIAFHSVRGTPYWMAPEVICGHGYGRKSDIWSLGCTVHEMAVTKPPWGDLPPEAAMFQIGIGTTTPRLSDTFSEELISLFNHCLQRDPSKRPTAHELLDNPFLQVSPVLNATERRKHK